MSRTPSRTPPSRLRFAFATVAVLAVAGVCGAALVIWGGLYNVASTRQHFQVVYSVLEVAMHRSVRLHARDVQLPANLDDPQRVSRGAACFQDKCVQCHGAPGVSQGDIGKSMQPLPGPLVDATQNFHPRELYWITKHGIRLSGMPAWEFRLTDEEMWDTVAFLQRLPGLTPQAYAEAAQWKPEGVKGSAPQAQRYSCGLPLEGAPTHSPDVQRGKQALYQYACSACHTIPGVTGSSPAVGPPLGGLASRTLIAGKLSNTPENMILWLRHPQKVKPLTAMPDLGVTQEHAADMAAYLATLR